MNPLFMASAEVRKRLNGAARKFLGEVPAAELINSNGLSSLLGFGKGTLMNTNEPWLHFIDGGKELFIAKRPLRYGMSWTQLKSANLIYGDRTVTIGGKQYRVRLIKGVDNDPFTSSNEHSQNTEWNRLLYPICTDRPAGYPEWASYTSAQLGMGVSQTGRTNWCQESQVGSTSRLIRGSFGLTASSAAGESYTWAELGWRPVLELIQ